jgi:hypothetical protein
MAWVGYQCPRDARVQHRRYHREKQRRAAMEKAMRALAAARICQELPVEDRCAAELDQLAERNPFSKFVVGMTLDTVDTQQAVAEIHAVAPTWNRILQRLLQNRRQHRPTYTARDRHLNVQRRIFSITSMACFSRSRINSNTLASCMDIYLVGSGVHRRVIETLHGLGLCHSYHHANSLMSQVAQHASVRQS